MGLEARAIFCESIRKIPKSKGILIVKYGINRNKLIKHIKKPMKTSAEIGIFPNMSPKPSKYGPGSKSYNFVTI